MPFGPKTPWWTLTCSPWVRMSSGGCATCCLLKKAEMEWGPPPPLSQGHWDATDFSADFLRIFAWLWNTYFQAPKRWRRICVKICAPNICAKMGAKISTPKICAAKICAAKICTKKPVSTFRFIFLEDGSPKKKEKLHQHCAKPQPQ